MQKLHWKNNLKILKNPLKGNLKAEKENKNSDQI